MVWSCDPETFKWTWGAGGSRAADRRQCVPSFPLTGLTDSPSQKQTPSALKIGPKPHPEHRDVLTTCPSPVLGHPDQGPALCPSQEVGVRLLLPLPCRPVPSTLRAWQNEGSVSPRTVGKQVSLRLHVLTAPGRRPGTGQVRVWEGVTKDGVGKVPSNRGMGTFLEGGGPASGAQLLHLVPVSLLRNSKCGSSFSATPAWQSRPFYEVCPA